ncbi:MAG: LPS export ABC transporter periplasmic protein LptC [Deltaproteobacteria bacterium RBG_16_48_10]|nr:MAG: LPS export ABC transporter periplasmic protein LptC [Deltaproteobacteria bacterium RBG_16_48_10]
MMRKTKIVILLLMVLIGGIVLVSLRANLRARKALEAVEKLPKVSTEGADMQLKKIRFVEDKQGQKTWELEAKSVHQYQEQNIMVLEDVKVTFYAKEGRIIYLTGKQGKVYQDSKNVDLLGDVVLTSSDGYQLKTHSASYCHSEKIVSTADPVEIDGEQIRLTGRGMLVNVEAKTFKILSQVKTQLRGGKKI